MRAHLATLVDEFCRHPSETAVVEHRGNRRYATTYGELAELAGRFAAELDRRGVVPGERVVLWGENSAAWIGVFFGCLLRGVIVVPLDAAGSTDFAVRVIADVAPRLIVGDAMLIDTLPQSVVPRLPLRDIAAHLPSQPLYVVSSAVNSQTPFQIVFTSGTTSEPRGIVHTHRNILVTLDPIEREMAKYRRAERIFHPLRFLHSIPLSHVFGQFMGLWCPALLAAELHFAEQLEPARVVGLIRRERISVLVAVPRMLHLLRAHLVGQFPTLAAQIDASAGMKIWQRWWQFRRVHSAMGWKFWAVISGGATLPADLEAFWNRLGFALIQGYGMTETAALVTLNHPFHIAQGSIGKPMPGREVKITDDGEILVRGEMLSGATWSGGAMRPREGEWLATGDLAERSATGELRFLGRKGDVIVTGAGMNVHPADLEAALAAQPGVHGAVVVACQIAGSAQPVAVVLFSGSDADLDAAVSLANRTLADYQQIRRVLRWPQPQLPYTSTGKLIRRQIAQWADATLAGRKQAAAPSRDALLSLIAEITGETIESPEPAALARLRLSEDLHLDSLGRVQLQSALEQSFAIELDDDALATTTTVADLRALIERQLNVPFPTNPQPSTNTVAPPPPSRGPLPSSRTTPQSSARTPPLLSSRSAAEGSAFPPTPPESSPTSTEAHTYPHWPWIWPIRLLRIAFIEVILRPLVWLLAAPRVVCEAKNLPDAPVLFIANHVTAYDGVLILYALPAKLRRRVAIAMSGELLADLRHARNQPNPLANLFAPLGYWLVTALFNVFPLPRARGFRRSFDHAGEAMDNGDSVLLFPEGMRSLDGKLHTFRPGIGLLAVESGVPIIPIALAGLDQLRAASDRSPAHWFRADWFRSGRIEVRIGQMIAAVGSDADPAHLAASLEQTVRTLLS